MRMGKKPIQNVGLNYEANHDFGILHVTSILQEGEDPASVIQALGTVLPQTVVAEHNQDAIADLGTELKVQDLSLLEKPHYYGMMKASGEETGRLSAEVFSEQGDHLIALKVSDNHRSHIIGHIVRLVIVTHLCACHPTDARGGAEDGQVVGRALKE